MFHNNFEALGTDIYVYKNFLSKDECESFVSIAENLPKEEWQYANEEMKDWHMVSKYVPETEILVEKLTNLIPNTLHVGPARCIVKMTDGCSWGEHSDNHTYLSVIEENKKLKEGDPYDLKPNSVWGFVIYFNKFNGGNIYYPTQNIEYDPEPGDLVVHSSYEHCKHGVRPVVSSTRYSYSNNFYEYIKVPKGNES